MPRRCRREGLLAAAAFSCERGECPGAVGVRVRVFPEAGRKEKEERKKRVRNDFPPILDIEVGLGYNTWNAMSRDMLAEMSGHRFKGVIYPCIQPMKGASCKGGGSKKGRK